ncbi:MAG: endonuclease/exonuclease/phosphatase family protein, partial [Chloroflexota bacterium]
ASGADVVFLQEVDSGRITSFQVDHAYWLASELGWHQLFAPTLEGLSGIAMISRYPLQDSSVEMLTSSGEQTALASARIRLGSQSVALHTMWLGLDTTERMIQINDAVSNIKGDDLAILGGDFNSEPGSEEIELIESLGYSDIAVDLKADDLMTDPAVDPDSRIDYLFSRGLEPIMYTVWPQVISDHRMVVSSMQIP